MPDFSKARDPLDVLDMMTAPARAFADGVRAANDEANLCSRKLRIAIVALELIAERTPRLPHDLQATAAGALDRIAGLK
jgi:hypothetical protein